jgi:hypothetical protein
MTEASSSDWHLDKRVPIATILAILGQAIMLGWVAASMNTRIDNLEEYTTELKASKLRERMAVIESDVRINRERFLHLDGQLDKLDTKIDKIADRVGARK